MRSLPSARVVGYRGLGTGRRLAAHLRGAVRAAAQRPLHWTLAWTGGLGVVQAASLCVMLAVQGRPLPHPVAVAGAAAALAVLAGLCLGGFLLLRTLGHGGRGAALLVGAGFYGFCAAGSAAPDALLTITLVPAGVLFAALLPAGPWMFLDPAPPSS